jgi:hypothetical protein
METEQVIEKEEDKFDKINMKVINKFKVELINQIGYLKKNLETSSKRIENSQIILVENIRTADIQRKQIEDMKIFSSNMGSFFKSQLEEIKTLSFVKSIKIVTEGIKIDVGEIYISFRGKEVYIGDFDIYLTPQGVSMKCRNPVLEYEDDKSSWKAHPHMRGNDKCYGHERGIIIQEYFAKFELKKLVYYLYLFLKSYNQSDNYNSITLWTKPIGRIKLKEAQ